MPVLYIPIDVDNPARDKSQKKLMADLMNEGWVTDGILYLTDSFKTLIKCMVLRKGD